ncbi:unnamed protein product [Clonostachys byssicola]|uniref:H-type lectin domain-containing protein n=1 Tax=Clonostachys byssicola TaxID=160290 RepID=A0A9N9UZ37_9HYPO|nr:unnamed protein product [Clonostachys byssicola]
MTIRPSLLWDINLAFSVSNDHQSYHWKSAMGHFDWGNGSTLMDDLINLSRFSTVKDKWARELPLFLQLVEAYLGPQSELTAQFNCVRSKLTCTAEWTHVADEANRLIELVATGKEKIQKAIDFLDTARSISKPVFPIPTVDLHNISDEELFRVAPSEGERASLWFKKIATSFENDMNNSTVKIPLLLKELKSYFQQVQTELEGFVLDMNDLAELTFFTGAEPSVSGLMQQSHNRLEEARQYRTAPIDTSNLCADSMIKTLSDMSSYAVAPPRFFSGRANTDDWLEGGWWNNRYLECRRNPLFTVLQAISSPIPWPSTPRVVAGVKTLHCGIGDHLRAKVMPTGVDNNGFTILMDCWIHSTDLKQIEACYLAISPEETDIQCGEDAVTASWRNVRREPDNSNSQTSLEEVFFSRPYDRKPTVLVWLTHIDSDKRDIHRIEVSASNVTTRGFTLNFRSWLDSSFFNYKANWIAFTEGRSDIAFYEYQWSRPSAGEFCNFYALTKLDADNERNIRVTLNADTVSHPTVETWGDSKLYDAKYIGIRISSCYHNT